jgi:phosphate-selective porin OprO/OprP
MKIDKSWLAAILAAQLAFTSHAADNTDTNRDADIEALKQQINALSQKVESLENERAADQPVSTNDPAGQFQELDQKVRILSRERELDQEAAAAAAKTQPKLVFGANGFNAISADSNFVFSLHGLIQADSRTFFNDNGGTLGKNTFLIRRARPIFTGTVFHDFDFNFTPDFGGTTVQIFDAYLNYRFSPELQLEAGKFKSPVGLEALQADSWTLFNERSIVTDLVPNRDVGFELHGDLFGGVASYAAGIFDGTSDYNGTTANQDIDDDKAFAGRVFLQPWKTSGVNALQGLGAGVSGSYEDDHGTAATSNLTPGYRTDGQQNFFTYATGVVPNGEHWRISPQGYYYYGPLSLSGEYVISDQVVSRTTAPLTSADLRNTAWEISAGWVLTGENASYNGVTPQHSFSPTDGQWGAWQIVARYADLEIDSAAFAVAGPFAAAGSASEAKAWSVGLNWYLNRDIRVNASFSRTTFAGGGGTAGPGPVTSQPENVFFTRIQLAF